MQVSCQSSKLTQRNVLFGCICSIINPSRTQPLCGWRYGSRSSYKEVARNLQPIQLWTPWFWTKSRRSRWGWNGSSIGYFKYDQETMPKQAPKQVKSMQPMLMISASFQPQFVYKSWLTKSNTMKAKLTDLYLNTYAQATDGNFEASIVYSSGLYNRCETHSWKDFDRVEEQGCCETTRLGNELVFHLLTPWVHSRICLDLGAWKWEWVKAALGGTRALTSCHLPSQYLQNSRALSRIQSLLWTTIVWYGYQPKHQHGNQRKSQRVWIWFNGKKQR